jgi:hypothetical protein
LVAVFVGAVSKLLSGWLDVSRRLMLLFLSWVAFYSFYFTAMSG